MLEIELKLTGGRIISAEPKDGVLKILVEETKKKCKVIPEVLETEVVREDVNSDQFILIPVSSLSLTDDFMCYAPMIGREKDFYELLTKVIKQGVSDFYRPKFDPSFDKQDKICYQAGRRPARGRSYNWWHCEAKKFSPWRKSRLGTKSEYVAFLGVLIKKLVERGWSKDDAWNVVCNDSRHIGHYGNSNGALHDFESTGSREICGFYDLANTYKILAEDKKDGSFWLAGGCYDDFGRDGPLATLNLINDRDNGGKYSVGWIVLEK